MLAPVGIAYAVAWGVEAIYGLYATIASLLAYALFGPSRILVLGPDSSLTTVIFGVISPLSAGDPIEAAALAAIMAIFSGAILVLTGVAKLGFVTELLSKPIRYGYMNGIALTVLISQLPKLLGARIESTEPLHDLWSIAWIVVGGKVNLIEFALGAGSLVAISLLRSRKRFPGVLAVMIGATAIVYFFNLAKYAGVSVVGALPRGLPAFSIPRIPLTELVPVAIGSCAAALISFADTSVLSRAYAAREGLRVDPSHEMVGLGAANLAAGFFHGFPVSSSSSRTPVAEAAGAKTQLTGVIGALGVTLLLLLAPNLLGYVPAAALAAVVISSAIGLIEVRDLRRLFRIQRWEFWLSIVCSAGVAIFGAIQGVGIAVVIAVIEFLWDGWRPHSAVLGRVEGIRGYHDITRYPQARQTRGLVLFRWDAPLFFANAEFFRESALAAMAGAPPPVQRLVVAAEPVTSVDVTAADVLSELNETLRRNGVKLCFAELKDPVKDKLKRFGLFDQFGEDSFFATIGAAVDEFRELDVPE
jgi:high affinity sulfate transporter 1